MSCDTTKKGKIIVFGIAFWYPLAGVTYQFLHYLIGLRRLGYDPYYIEDSGRWVYDPRPEINEWTPDATANIDAVASIFVAHGFADRWAFRGNYPGGQCYGMTEQEILRLYKEADAFLNVTGAQEIREEHMVCPQRIYVESDPFLTQVGAHLGNKKTVRALAAHTQLFSFGENLGEPDCTVPLDGFKWLPTRQPILLDFWKNPFPAEGKNYNTIATWSNKGKDITYLDETYYWTKDREFMKVIDLPRRCSASFELALGVSKDVCSLLIKHNWLIANSVETSRDLNCYRSYIQSSRGEFTVARDQYVRPKTGWFSDRSACYLAAGRPVITQETGFSKFLPTGKGLFGFNAMDNLIAAVETVEHDYEDNCRAAREIASEYFAAEKVIARLMDRSGL